MGADLFANFASGLLDGYVKKQQTEKEQGIQQGQFQQRQDLQRQQLGQQQEQFQQRQDFQASESEKDRELRRQLSESQNQTKLILQSLKDLSDQKKADKKKKPKTAQQLFALRSTVLNQLSKESSAPVTDDMFNRYPAAGLDVNRNQALMDMAEFIVGTEDQEGVSELVASQNAISNGLYDNMLNQDSSALNEINPIPLAKREEILQTDFRFKRDPRNKEQDGAPFLGPQPPPGTPLRSIPGEHGLSGITVEQANDLVQRTIQQGPVFDENRPTLSFEDFIFQLVENGISQEEIFAVLQAMFPEDPNARSGIEEMLQNPMTRSPNENVFGGNTF